ncbi:hypothetical protein D0N50_11050 [Erwinia billingiae]|nr:hypothetical protein D0N50_11050 [Erwinia billingiae]
MTKIDLKWFLEKMILLCCILALVLLTFFIAIFIGCYFYTLNIAIVGVLIILVIIMAAFIIQ